MTRRGISSVLSVALLAGCALLPDPELQDASQMQARWQQHAAQLEAMDHWELRGRFGVMWSEGQLQGALTWKQQGTMFEMSLRGPFGLGAIQVQGDWETGTGVLHDGKAEYAGQLAPLLREHLGVALPFVELARLVRGLPPSGEATHLEYDAQARARRIEQNGWQVEYQDYSCCAEPALPGHMRFTYEELRGAVAVREWVRE